MVDSCELKRFFSPCSMCTGAVLLYRIPRVVVGENVTYKGGDEYLRSKGVEVIIVDDEECRELMGKFIKEHPEVSNRFSQLLYPSMLVCL